MKEDKYGAAIERTLRTTEEPLTAAEIVERVGCSRQRVYVWLAKNQMRLTEVDRNRRGAARYVWRTAGDGPGVSTGATLTVESISLLDGRVHLELVADDGSKFNAVPA